MARLKPLDPNEDEKSTTVSVSVSEELARQIDAETERVGAKNRSVLCRMIFEQYFAQTE